MNLAYFHFQLVFFSARNQLKEWVFQVVRLPSVRHVCFLGVSQMLSPRSHDVMAGSSVGRRSTRSTRSTQAISWICVGGKPELSTSSNGWYKKHCSCFGRGNWVVSKTKSVTRSCPHRYEQTAKAFVIKKHCEDLIWPSDACDLLSCVCWEVWCVWCITDLMLLWLKNTLETWSDPPTLVICFLVCAGRCDVFDASQTWCFCDWKTLWRPDLTLRRLWFAFLCVLGGVMCLMHHRPDAFVTEKHFGDLIWPSDACDLLSCVCWEVWCVWCITDLMLLWLKNTLETWSDPPTLVICFLVCAGRCDVFDASQTWCFCDWKTLWRPDLTLRRLWLAFFCVLGGVMCLMHHRPDTFVIEKHFGDLIWPSDACYLLACVCWEVWCVWCITDLMLLWLKNTLETWSDPPTLVICFLVCAGRCDVFWCITDLMLLWLKNTLETWSDPPTLVICFLVCAERCDVFDASQTWCFCDWKTLWRPDLTLRRLWFAFLCVLGGVMCFDASQTWCFCDWKTLWRPDLTLRRLLFAFLCVLGGVMCFDASQTWCFCDWKTLWRPDLTLRRLLFAFLCVLGGVMCLMHHRPDASVIEKHFGDLIWPSDACYLLSCVCWEVWCVWCITDLILLWLKNTLETWSDPPTLVICFLVCAGRCDVFWCITDLMLLWLKNTLETWSDPPTLVICFLVCAGRCDVFWCITDLMLLWLKNTLETWSDPPTLVICFLVCAGRCDVFDASQTWCLCDWKTLWRPDLTLRRLWFVFLCVLGGVMCFDASQTWCFCDWKTLWRPDLTLRRLLFAFLCVLGGVMCFDASQTWCFCDWKTLWRPDLTLRRLLFAFLCVLGGVMCLMHHRPDAFVIEKPLWRPDLTLRCLSYAVLGVIQCNVMGYVYTCDFLLWIYWLTLHISYSHGLWVRLLAFSMQAAWAHKFRVLVPLLCCHPCWHARAAMRLYHSRATVLIMLLQSQK